MSLRVTQEIKTPDYAEINLYTLTGEYQYTVIEPTVSPTKNTDTKLISPNKYNQEVNFINEFFSKKMPTTPKKIEKKVIPTKITIKKTRLEFKDNYRCVICKRNNHDTRKCYLRCSKPSCVLLDHHRFNCPYYSIKSRK